MYKKAKYLFIVLKVPKKYNTGNTIPKLLKIPNTLKILNNYKQKISNNQYHKYQAF